MSFQCIGIVGAGRMGADMVTLALAHGLRVVAVDSGEARRSGLSAQVTRGLEQLEQHLRWDPARFAGWEQRLTIAPLCPALAPCEFVIESVFEDASVKAAVLREIESAVGPRVPIGSNTSSLPITQLQTGLSHPERVLGMHFCQPAYAVPFLEIIRGEMTSEETFAAGEALGLQLGKEPCLVRKDAPGFVVNRLGYALYREALHLVAEGISDPESIDRAVRNTLGIFTPLCGPFRWMDISGGPALYGKAMETIFPSLDNSDKPSALIQRLMEAKAGGVDTGAGFYEYAEEDAAIWDNRYREHVWRQLQLRQESPESDD